MDPNLLINSTPGITEYNYFSSFLQTFLEDFMSKVSRPNPIALTRAKTMLLQFMRSPEVLAKVGFDASFHFRIDVVPDAARKKIICCLNPLTPLALDCCIALKIPVDESLVAQIRKAYNESLAELSITNTPPNA